MSCEFTASRHQQECLRPLSGSAQLLLYVTLSCWRKSDVEPRDCWDCWGPIVDYVDNVMRLMSHCQSTSTTVTGPVGERLQAGTEDAPVLDRPAPLRHHDSLILAPDINIQTYLLTCLPFRVHRHYIATSNDMKLVHWPLMGGPLHLVQRGGPSSMYQM